jgi:hypothetical protein
MDRMVSFRSGNRLQTPLSGPRNYTTERAHHQAVETLSNGLWRTGNLAPELSLRWSSNLVALGVRAIL